MTQKKVKYDYEEYNKFFFIAIAGALVLVSLAFFAAIMWGK